jgi:hypothetical protein
VRVVLAAAVVASAVFAAERGRRERSIRCGTISVPQVYRVRVVRGPAKACGSRAGAIVRAYGPVSP